MHTKHKQNMEKETTTSYHYYRKSSEKKLREEGFGETLQQQRPGTCRRKLFLAAIGDRAKAVWIGSQFMTGMSESGGSYLEQPDRELEALENRQKEHAWKW